MVADALSRKAQHSLNTIMITQPCVLEDLERLGVELVSQEYTCPVVCLRSTTFFGEEIRSHQEEDVKLQRIKQNLEKGKSPGFLVDEDGTLRFQK